MKIFVAGDKYFKPEIVIGELKKRLEGCGEPLEFDGVELPYPIDHLSLSDGYVVPSGMAWDQNMDDDYGTQGVREYYGNNETLKGLLGDCDILIIHGAALPKARIDEAKNLKLLCCMRGGPVNIDLEYAKSRGILATNSPGKNAQGVAEYTIGLLLSHIRHIPAGNRGLYNDEYIQRFGYYENLGWELEGKNFGLIGFGNIAQRLTKILNGFGCHVYAFDPFIDPEIVKAKNAVPVSLEELLQVSDIVSIHARGKNVIIGEEQLKLMKPTAILLNTARGMLLDYKALRKAVEEKKIAGAAMDVFGPEPYKFYRELTEMDTITTTPHMAGVTRETVMRGISMTGDEIERFLRKEPLRYQL